MRLHLCGVRGSTPAPGPAFTRVGGHTSCVAVAHDGDERPRLLLDAGTGLRNVAALLGDAPFEGALLLGHLHWDHTQGIPFFAAGDRPDARVDVHLPVAGGDAGPRPRRDDGATVLPDRVPAGCAGAWSFHALERGHVRGRGLHRAGPRDPAPRRAHVRLPCQRRRRRRSPTCPTTARSPSAAAQTAGVRTTTRVCELADGVDLLAPRRPVHGRRAGRHGRTSATRPSTTPWRWPSAATSVGCCCFHHDPERTDDEVDALVAAWADASVDVDAAREGETICW